MKRLVAKALVTVLLLALLVEFAAAAHRRSTSAMPVRPNAVVGVGRTGSRLLIAS